MRPSCEIGVLYPEIGNTGCRREMEVRCMRIGVVHYNNRTNPQIAPYERKNRAAV